MGRLRELRVGRFSTQGYTGTMKQLTTFVVHILLITFLLAQGFTVRADGDQDEARRLLKSGDILSLELILEKVRSSHPGKILEVELEKESGKTIYEIEMLGDDGVVREFIIDARTGDLLENKRDH